MPIQRVSSLHTTNIAEGMGTIQYFLTPESSQEFFKSWGGGATQHRKTLGFFFWIVSQLSPKPFFHYLTVSSRLRRSEIISCLHLEIGNRGGEGVYLLIYAIYSLPPLFHTCKGHFKDLLKSDNFLLLKENIRTLHFLGNFLIYPMKIGSVKFSKLLHVMLK